MDTKKYNPSPILVRMKVGGYRFLKYTWYGAKHRGTDWQAYYESIYAPTDGEVIQSFWAPQMGYQIHFIDSFNFLHRFGHLSYKPRTGKFKCGDAIAKTGNSGMLTTVAHLHHDISRNGKLELYNLDNFFDPEIYLKSRVR